MTKSNPNTPEDELKQKSLADGLESMWITSRKYRDPWMHMAGLLMREDRTNLITQLEAKKYTAIAYTDESEREKSRRVGFNAGIDTAIEVLRGEL